ncbi:hypothetical protein LTR62_000737 [Meristemomyces frigidus]|uniref:Uncharacterized protein n=1 Tax=Meristemomyces frigidus TaxID=1508187 RepID=A0AAN7T910_9PEZI|nr:hypothetical protein LTR62_000737 [Meristemomyces frigidus]
MSATISITATNIAHHGISTSKLLIGLWAVTTTLWSVFRPPQQTYAARMLLLQPAWIVRIVRKDWLWAQDLALCLVSHAAYSYLAGHWRLCSRGDFSWLDPKDSSTHIYYQIFSLLAICSCFAGGIVFRGRRLYGRDSDIKVEQRIDDQVLPALLLTSKTTHSRLFPKKHSFSYSYLLVGIPVGVQGQLNKILSVDSTQRAWFHVDAADYLTRGGADSTLADKLKAYLHTQGVTDRQYAYAYLVTAPRFLGYSFNPVSFWYLYDSDIKLKYMILEVNNTFDERRMYLLKGADVKKEDLDGLAADSGAKAPGYMIFSDTWQKDFHVSPFNSRKGSYTLRAVDPVVAFQESGKVKIDSTIVLRSSKEHPKIVARIFSVDDAKVPATITTLEAVKFILLWCWVGFATSPRIVWQASRLFFKRKLDVWYRPEVSVSSLGRPYSEDEEQLEVFFRAFLTNAVEKSSKPLRVIYEPAHGEEGEIVLYSPAFTYQEDHERTLTLKIMSPAFYSRFVHYSSASEALEKECLAPDERNRTAHLERADLLPDILNAIEEQYMANRKQPRSSSFMDQYRWPFMRQLRCPAAGVAYPSESSKNNSHFPPPARFELDAFAWSTLDNDEPYRRILTKLFLAQRFGFGIPALIALLDLTIRMGLLVLGMWYCDTVSPIDLLQPRSMDWQEDGLGLVKMMGLANGVHIWRFVKG